VPGHIASIPGRPRLTDDVNSKRESDATVVAFYLPQYHPIPENDAWWGADFTDWTNVRRATPLFDGHNQPRVPRELGYYDLRDPDVHHAQAALAKAHGVSAFCYYAYWFEGRRLLEAPLELVAANPDLAMPYAICWANEPWSRRWDGSEQQILVAQRHRPESDARFIDDMAHHLVDPRYVRVRDKPLLLLYRPGLLREPLRTTDAMRERAQQLGIGELFLGMVQTFGHWEPISYGFDAAVEFPPHNLAITPAAARPRKAQTAGASHVAVASYRDAIRAALATPVPPFMWFRGVMPDWDNTPRRGARGTVYQGADPETFRAWLGAVLECTYLFRRPGERLVFVNAWNEWAEGAHLEPDVASGDSYLRAIGSALRDARDLADETATLSSAVSTPQSLLALARAQWTGDPVATRGRLA
jgi:lipopolysaccharide biosynthesis protein